MSFAVRTENLLERGHLEGCRRLNQACGRLLRCVELFLLWRHGYRGLFGALCGRILFTRGGRLQDEAEQAGNEDRWNQMFRRFHDVRLVFVGCFESIGCGSLTAASAATTPAAAAATAGTAAAAAAHAAGPSGAAGACGTSAGAAAAEGAPAGAVSRARRHVAAADAVSARWPTGGLRAGPVSRAATDPGATARPVARATNATDTTWATGFARATDATDTTWATGLACATKPPTPPGPPGLPAPPMPPTPPDRRACLRHQCRRHHRGRRVCPRHQCRRHHRHRRGVLLHRHRQPANSTGSGSAADAADATTSIRSATAMGGLVRPAPPCGRG